MIEPSEKAIKGAILYAMVEDFMDRQRIGGPETIYQCDWVIEAAYEFMDRLCTVVGYPKEGEEEYE